MARVPKSEVSFDELRRQLTEEAQRLRSLAATVRACREGERQRVHAKISRMRRSKPSLISRRCASGSTMCITWTKSVLRSSE